MTTRLARLDAVRALAVLLVLLYHLSYRIPPTDADFIGRGLRVIGWLGVDLFFVLSGYLIASILMKPATRADMGSFARKRIWRIFPVLILSVFTFGLADAIISNGKNISLLWIPLLALNGYIVPVLGFDVVPFTIVWSLSVELTAYALFALIARLSWASFSIWLWLIVVMAPLLRIWLIFGAQWPEAIVAVFPPARLDTLALGGLVAVGAFGPLLKFRRAQLIWGSATLACLLGARFAAWVPYLTETVVLSLFGVTAALWIGSLANLGRASNTVSWPLRAAARIGLVSYFIYLFHLFVIEGLIMLGSATLGFWANFVLASALAIGCAGVSWRLLEAPLIAYAQGHRKTA